MFLPPEEIRDVKELPVFVWDDVLLPFIKFHKSIHVTQLKYAQMLEDIEFDSRLFGVTPNIMMNREIGLPHINSTGCIARLLECNTFKSGDSLIKIEGLARYRIVKYLETGKPYPIAEIKFFEEENERYHDSLRIRYYEERAEELEELMNKTCHAAQRVLTKIFYALGRKDYEAPLMRPPDPVAFSFRIIHLFSFDRDDRIHVLQSPCPFHRLEFALEWLEDYEKGVEDNIKRHEFIEPFLKLANNKNNPDLS